ncbi:hypothetical protein ACRAWF_27070 [Streptomyces sp. L7]
MPQLGLRLGVISAALTGLVLNEAAYLSEIVRAGVMSVPRGQSESRPGARHAAVEGVPGGGHAAGAAGDGPAARLTASTDSSRQRPSCP